MKCLRDFQPFFIVETSTFDDPGKNPWKLRLQFLSELFVFFVALELLLVGDEDCPIPDGIIRAIRLGDMICGEVKFTIWLERERQPVRVSSGDRVITSESLELG